MSDLDLLVSDGTDHAALYFMRRTASLTREVELLCAVIKDLLAMPEYDGTAATSQIRLKTKNRAKRAVRNAGVFMEEQT